MMQARAPSWWPAAAVQCLEDLTSYRLAGASECIGRIGEALVAVAEATHGPFDLVLGRVAEAGVHFAAPQPFDCRLVLLAPLTDPRRTGPQVSASQLSPPDGVLWHLR
jgi:hypothetical protein